MGLDLHMRRSQVRIVKEVVGAVDGGAQAGARRCSIT
jgi:hypothetical protein